MLLDAVTLSACLDCTCDEAYAVGTFGPDIADFGRWLWSRVGIWRWLSAGVWTKGDFSADF